MVFGHTKSAVANSFKKFGEAFSSVKSIFGAFEQDLREIGGMFKAMWAEVEKLAKGITENTAKAVDRLGTYISLYGHTVKSNFDAYLAGANAMRTTAGMVNYLETYGAELVYAEKGREKEERAAYVKAALKINSAEIGRAMNGLKNMGFQPDPQNQNVMTLNQGDAIITAKFGQDHIDLRVKRKY